MSLPFVSVIVPVMNGERTLRACLTSLVNLDYPVDRREIIVVDNGSTDRTAEIIDLFPVRAQREPSRGKGVARNSGVKASHGEILAFTDADCVVSRNWLQEVVKCFEEKTVGGVAGEIAAFPPKTPAEAYAAKIRHLSPQKYLSRPFLPFAAFANLTVRREGFDRVGGIDEGLDDGESTDFCTRFVRGTGLKLVYAPRALVLHQHRRTARSFFQQQWDYGRGHALLYIKYRGELKWGMRQTMLAYRQLIHVTWVFVRQGLRYGSGRAQRQDLHFAYFDFLKKLAERMGFIKESISRGYFYF